MRVLLVTSRYPLPPWRGNQVRSMEWLEALSDHPRALVCPRGGPGNQSLDREIVVYGYGNSSVAKAVGAARAILVGRPIQEGLYDSGRRTLRRALRSWRPEVVVVQMVRCGWALDVVESEAAGQPVIFDAIDAMGLHFESAAAQSAAPLRWAMRLEAGRCRRRERSLAGRARISVAVSSRDLEAIQPPAGRGAVVPVAGREIPPSPSPPLLPTVLLSGNLGYRPTVLGSQWFAERVWPRLLGRVPGVRWVLAGARPAPAVRRLADLPHVEVHGDVTDLDRHVASSSVAIAPMSTGSGVPMKVLEAWAAGVPVVAHPWVAGGLGERAAGALVVADDAEQWLEALVRLLSDRDMARRVADRGRNEWRRRFHPDRVAASVRDVVGDATEHLRKPTRSGRRSTGENE